MREEFEKLPEIANIISKGDIFFNDVLGVYGSKSGDDLAAGFVSGALYAHQEQQKKIDELDGKLDDLKDEIKQFSMGGEF